MNAKYYPIIKFCRQAALLKRRLTLPVKLFTSGFINWNIRYFGNYGRFINEDQKTVWHPTPIDNTSH